MKKQRFRVLVAAVAFAIIAILGTAFFRAFSDGRSALGREMRLWKGEHYPDQYVNDLANDISINSAFAQLQPWAVSTMARYHTGELKTNKHVALTWTDDSVTLHAAEMPKFLGAEWTITNKHSGWVTPLLSVLLSKGQPECVVLLWRDFGVAVGHPEYQLSFDVAIRRDVAPGVYVFGLRE
jgi:hypothetical protein